MPYAVRLVPTCYVASLSATKGMVNLLFWCFCQWARVYLSAFRRTDKYQSNRPEHEPQQDCDYADSVDGPSPRCVERASNTIKPATATTDSVSETV